MPMHSFCPSLIIDFLRKFSLLYHWQFPIFTSLHILVRLFDDRLLFFCFLTFFFFDLLEFEVIFELAEDKIDFLFCQESRELWIFWQFMIISLWRIIWALRLFLLVVFWFLYARGIERTFSLHFFFYFLRLLRIWLYCHRNVLFFSLYIWLSL